MSRLTACLVAVLTAFMLVLFMLAPTNSISAEAASPPAAQPQQEGILGIPFDQAPADIDGECIEYGDGVEEEFHDAGGVGTVFLKHDGQNLYVCMQAQPGTFGDRFGALYLDPQGDGASYQFARQDDFSLRVGIPGQARSTWVGSGVANGYVSAPGFDAAWDGIATASAEGETVEYRVTLGRFFLAPCELFGVAAYHHWVTAVGDDYGWPSSEFFDQPRTWQTARLDSPTCDGPEGEIAYVFRGDTADAVSFFNLLTANGYSVDLVPLGDVLTTNFSVYDLILIADDSGYLDQWGLPAVTASQVAQITAPNKPILGIGEGGYAFFGQLSLFIGWPNGWHGPQDSVDRAPGAPLSYFSGLPADPIQAYANPVNEVGIYLGGTPPPADVVPIGLEPPSPDHSSLILQGCRHLWGFSGNPTEMAPDGETLFLNAVQYMRAFQCPPADPPPPDETCVAVDKVASPPHGTSVAPGDVIEYTINYVWSDDPLCQNATQTKLLDSVPPDTHFVPGSATGGITPGADGALVWPVSQAAGQQTESFKVRVSDTQCHNQRTVVNRAGLLVPSQPPVTSNVVSHPVECPPLTFPNDEPPYAENEIQIDPYPLVTGQPSTITVKVSNTSTQTKEVVVSFQTSPNRFGIGLGFNTFATKTVVIPPMSNVIVETTFTPVSSGHYCIQVVVQGTDPGDEPIKTQRNLDVTEDLTPGVPDDLVFKVGNPTANTADIQLVVDNTCPGWTAVVSPTLLTNVSPGEVRDATLTVTPPNPATLGSGCHIDVQGWIGDQLIGGIRKLDVPPVHLPVEVDPPWMEQEISVIPDPPVVGQPGQICVELQNPLPVSRTVTLDYAVADFGAGIFFTTVATREVTLPPNSLDKYCANWTPATGGTLHRCIRVTLKQDNYEDQHSQLNVDVVEFDLGSLAQLDLPVLVRNPDLVPHNLQLMLTTFGIHPAWMVALIGEDGQAPPDMIGPGETLNLQLQFQPMQARQSSPAASSFSFGDESRVEVAVLMDGAEIGGFSFVLEEQPRLFLPLIVRQ